MGDFSADSPKVKASLKNLTTCGNPYIICSTALDPVVQRMLALVPVGAPANPLRQERLHSSQRQVQPSKTKVRFGWITS